MAEAIGEHAIWYLPNCAKMFILRHKIKSLENHLSDKKLWVLVKIDRPKPHLNIKLQITQMI